MLFVWRQHMKVLFLSLFHRQSYRFRINTSYLFCYFNYRYFRRLTGSNGCFLYLIFYAGGKLEVFHHLG